MSTLIFFPSFPSLFFSQSFFLFLTCCPSYFFHSHHSQGFGCKKKKKKDAGSWTEMEERQERIRERQERVCEWKQYKVRGGGEKLHRTGGAGVKMRESFLSCLPAPANQSVMQSIPQTEAFFFSLPLDVLYLAGVSLQLDIKPCWRSKINNI